MDPPENVARIFAQNAPASGAFLDQSGTKVLPVAEVRPCRRINRGYIL